MVADKLPNMRFYRLEIGNKRLWISMWVIRK